MSTYIEYTTNMLQPRFLNIGFSIVFGNYNFRFLPILLYIFLVLAH